MATHETVSKNEWLLARKELLAEEKKFTRLRDQLSERRRALPWLRVDKEYVFEGPEGRETLGDLFAGRSQLVVYHFMFAPEWDEGCRGCSFWADNFNGVIPHIEQRDVTFVAISRAPLAKLQAFAKRLGWTFKWVSSAGNDFNYDFHVSFKPGEVAEGTATYNYAAYQDASPDKEGIGVFAKDESGAIFHTYGCYARGLDMMNTAYHYLDLVPKGRDEGDHPMSWVKHRDRYER